MLSNFLKKLLGFKNSIQSEIYSNGNFKNEFNDNHVDRVEAEKSPISPQIELLKWESHWPLAIPMYDGHGTCTG